MKNSVFSKFKELFTERCNKIALLDMGEDSVRYDFFIALSEKEKLKPSDIQLEYSIHKSAYLERKNPNSKRKENPQIDLVVDNDILKLNIEFGLFRQNSNENGNINKTARTVKMINDMIRLALDSFYSRRKAYFICVADDKMLGHQLKTKLLGKFPSNYTFSNDFILKQQETKTSDFDIRFLQVLDKLDVEITGEIVYNEKIEADFITKETRIIIWEINSRIRKTG